MAKARLTKKHIKQILKNNVDYYTVLAHRIKTEHIKCYMDYHGEVVTEDMCVFTVLVLNNILEHITILETEAPEKIKNIQEHYDIRRIYPKSKKRGS